MAAVRGSGSQEDLLADPDGWDRRLGGQSGLGSETMRGLRLRWLLALGAVAVGVAGCGGGPAEERAVRKVGTAYFDALANGDSKAACALIDPQDGEDRDGVCRGSVSRRARFTTVRLQEPRFNATLALAVAVLPGGQPAREVAFEKKGGRWLIDDPFIPEPSSP